MELQELLANVDPGWYGEVAPALLPRAQSSRIGQRLLVHWLAVDAAPHLFAPSPQGLALAAVRWPRTQLMALTRDLGALAFAPAIRAEVRREPVRQLRHVLGNSYLLALDQSVWDGRVSISVSKHLAAELNAALDHGPNRDEALLALFDYQGRNEVRAASDRHDPALAEWMALLHPHEETGPAYLPARPVTMLFTHHGSRVRIV